MKRFHSFFCMAALFAALITFASCNNNAAETASIGFSLGEIAANQIQRTAFNETGSIDGTYKVYVSVYQYSDLQMDEEGEWTEEKEAKLREMHEKMFKFNQNYTVSASELATKTYTVGNIPLNTPITVSVSITYKSPLADSQEIVLYYNMTEPFSLYEGYNTLQLELNKVGYHVSVEIYLKDNEGQYIQNPDLTQNFTLGFDEVSSSNISNITTAATEKLAKTMLALAAQGYTMSPDKVPEPVYYPETDNYIIKVYFDKGGAIPEDEVFTGVAVEGPMGDSYYQGTFTLTIRKDLSYTIYWNKSEKTDPILFAKGSVIPTAVGEDTITLLMTETGYLDNDEKFETEANEKIQEITLDEEGFTYTTGNNVVLKFGDSVDTPSLDTTFSVTLEKIEGDTEELTIDLYANGTMLAATEGYALYSWIIDGYTMEDYNNCLIDIRDNRPGIHNVTLAVKDDDGSVYTVTTSFTIERGSDVNSEPVQSFPGTATVSGNEEKFILTLYFDPETENEISQTFEINRIEDETPILVSEGVWTFDTSDDEPAQSDTRTKFLLTETWYYDFATNDMKQISKVTEPQQIAFSYDDDECTFKLKSENGIEITFTIEPESDSDDTVVYSGSARSATGGDVVHECILTIYDEEPCDRYEISADIDGMLTTLSKGNITTEVIEEGVSVSMQFAENYYYDSVSNEVTQVLEADAAYKCTVSLKTETESTISFTSSHSGLTFQFVIKDTGSDPSGNDPITEPELKTTHSGLATVNGESSNSTLAFYSDGTYKIVMAMGETTNIVSTGTYFEEEDADAQSIKYTFIEKEYWSFTDNMLVTSPNSSSQQCTVSSSGAASTKIVIDSANETHFEFD